MGAMTTCHAEEGALAGAAGAIIAESLAEAIFTPSKGDSFEALKEKKRYASELAKISTVFVGGVLCPHYVESMHLAAVNALENNFLNSLFLSEEENEEIEEEAENSDLGKVRKLYTKPLKKAAKSAGLDKYQEAIASYEKRFEGGIEGYVEEKLSWTEKMINSSLSARERELLTREFEAHYYDSDMAAHHMMQGFGKLTLIPGELVEWFAKHTGLTDRGNARALGEMVNDAIAVIGAVSLGKMAVKGASKKVVSSVSGGPASSQKVSLAKEQWIEKTGKTPIRDMSDPQYIQELANRAEKAKGPDIGPRQGVLKHEYAENLHKKSHTT